MSAVAGRLCVDDEGHRAARKLSPSSYLDLLLAMAEEPIAGQAFFARIPKTHNEAESCRELYDDWALTYDQHLGDASHGYVGPVEAAKAIVQNIGTTSDLTILDAGCGTGLSGIAVREALGDGAIIDGIDISPGMLEIAAQKSIYRKLDAVNLSERIAIDDSSYSAVVCVGTLTGGHVGPIPSLREFVRVVKSSGLVVATIKESVYDLYDAEIQRLKNAGGVTVVSTESVPYRQAQGVNAKLLVMRKL